MSFELTANLPETLSIIEEVIKILEPQEDIELMDQLEIRREKLREANEQSRLKIREQIEFLTGTVDNTSKMVSTITEDSRLKIEALENEERRLRSEMEKLQKQSVTLKEEEKKAMSELESSMLNGESEIERLLANIAMLRSILSLHANISGIRWNDQCARDSTSSESLMVSGILVSGDQVEVIERNPKKESRYKIVNSLWEKL